MLDRKRPYSRLVALFLLMGLSGGAAWAGGPQAGVDPEEAGNGTAAFAFPLAVGNQWVYERTIVLRLGASWLGASLPGALQRARLSIPFEYSPNHFIARLDGFNPFRGDTPLFADMSSTPHGAVISRQGQGRVLRGMLLPNRLAVADILNHLSGRPLNPKNLVFSVAAVATPVTVPAGVFKNAIQVNFSYADSLIGASGKIFLVSGVGIVKVETTFNGPIRGIGFSGTARVELLSYILSNEGTEPVGDNGR